MILSVLISLKIPSSDSSVNGVHISRHGPCTLANQVVKAMSSLLVKDDVIKPFPRLLQDCLMDISVNFHWCFKNESRWFQENFKSFSKMS